MQLSEVRPEALDIALTRMRSLLHRAFEREGAKSVTQQQASFCLACHAVSHFLMEIGEAEAAQRFKVLAEALYDVSRKAGNSLLPLHSGKGGRSDDSTTVWQLRALVCVGLRHFTAAGMKKKHAIADITKRYGKKLAKLQRPRTQFHTSLESWHTILTARVRPNRDFNAWAIYLEETHELVSARMNLAPADLISVGESYIQRAIAAAAKLAGSNPRP